MAYQPGYNPAYPQPGQQQYYGAPPPQYQYPQQYAAPQAYAAPQQAAQPIVVNVTTSQTQQQQQQPLLVPMQRTVFLGRQYNDDTTPAIIILIVGWFCCFVWLGGFRFIRSKNKTARVLGIVSVVLFFMAAIGVILAISLSIAAANAAANLANNNGGYSSRTFTATVSGYSASNTQSFYIPSGYAYSSVSFSATGTWYANSQGSYYTTTADGYASTYCYQSSCLSTSGNLMELVAKCGYYGSWTAIGSSYSYFYCTGGNTVYLAPNMPAATYGGGSVYVSATAS